MTYRFIVPRGSEKWGFELLPYGNHQKVVVAGVIVLDISKLHNHRYEFNAFVYSSCRIITGRNIKSKKELFGAIQLLLQEELHVDVQ